MTMCLTGMFFLVVTRLFVTIVPMQDQVREEVLQLRDASTVLARLGRELRTSGVVYQPSGNWTTFYPEISTGDGEIMFVINGPPDGPSTGTPTAYWFHETEGTIRRISYQLGGFTFGVPASYLPSADEPDPNGQVLARDVEDFRLTRVLDNGTTFIRFELKVRTVEKPLTAQVRLLPTPGL